ncbi:TIM barrel protein [Paenibacillus sp. JTLBN-2024]
MKKGINQWCFPPGTPLSKVLRTSSAAGFDTIELNLYAPGGVGLTMDTTPEDAKALGRLVRSYGLTISSLSTEMLGKYPLSSPDKETRSLGVESVRKQIELALELEVDTILVVPGRIEENVSYEEVWERSTMALQPLIDDIAGTPLSIAIENVWNQFRGVRLKWPATSTSSNRSMSGLISTSATRWPSEDRNIGSGRSEAASAKFT